MAGPEAGIREMARVTRPGGIVAARVWDHAGGRGPSALSWRAVRDLDAGAQDESRLPGVCDGHLAELFQRAGLTPAAQATIAVRASFRDVTACWQPFTLGAGPAGAYVASPDPDHRARLRARCTQLLPAGRFDVEATAWTVSARIRDRGPERRGRLPDPAQRALLDAAAHT